MRISPRLVAAAIAAVTACGAAPVSASQVVVGRMPPAVAGTTTFTATRPATVLVRLPKAVRLSLDDVARFRSHGRLNGFVLRHTNGSALVEQFGMGYCVRAGCDALFPYGSATGGVMVRQADGSWGVGPEGTLPAGIYAMHLVPDGAPLRVTIRFRGLAGSRSVSASRPLRAAFVAPPADATLPAPPSPVEPGAVYSAGSTGTIPATGGHVVFALWKTQAAPHQPTLAGECLYPGPATGPYQYPCGGRSTVPYVVGNAGTGQAATLGGYVTKLSGSYEFFPDERRAWSIGAYADSAHATDPRLIQLWLGY